MFAWIWIIASALLGTAAVRRLAARAFGPVEGLAAGIGVGWVGATWLAYGVAWLQGGFNPLVVMGQALGLAVAAGVVWRPLLPRAGSLSWRQLAPGDRQQVILVALLLPLVVTLFAGNWLAPRPDGLYASGRTWNTVGWHASLAMSMLSSDNVPPQNPVMAGVGLGYHFLSDCNLAVLMGMGVSLHEAATVTGVTLILAIAVLVLGLARRMTGQVTSAALALVIFLLGGGVGFAYILEYARTTRLPIWETLLLVAEADQALDYTHLHVANVLTDGLLPHRPLLYGMAVALVVVLLVARVWREADPFDDDDTPVATAPERVRLLTVAGLLVGLLPLWHFQTWLVLLTTAALWALALPQRGWIGFFAGAVVPATPQVVFLLAGADSRVMSYWHPGWFALYDGDVLLFWLRNFGVPLLVAVPAWRALPSRWRAFLMPFWAVLGLASTVMFSPVMDDNVQLMHFWQLANAVAVAEWLRQLTEPPQRQRWLAVALTVGCIASGCFAVIRETRVGGVVFQQADVQAASFIRQQTDRRAVFAMATIDDNLGPVALAGRRAVAGSMITDWGLGVGGTPEMRRYDVARIFRNDPEAKALLVRYGVDYIYLGPNEVWQYQAKRQALAKRYPVVYDRNGLTIFQARRPVVADPPYRMVSAVP